jgi:hypothetical protein
MLAFGENEPAARNVVGAMGFNLVEAGRGLIWLSAAYSRPGTDRAGLRTLVERALRLAEAVPPASRQGRLGDNAIEYQTNFINLRDTSLST